MSRFSTIGLPKPIVLKCSICFNEVNIAYFLCIFSPNFMDIPDILVISIDLLYKPDIPNIIFVVHIWYLL